MLRTLAENAKLLPKRLTFSEKAKTYKIKKNGRPLRFKNKMTAGERALFHEKLDRNRFKSTVQLALVLSILAIAAALILYFIFSI
jgi:hypothetical protein